jgi:hypothetical protein
MQELLYRAGNSTMAAGMLSLLFCFALFGGRLVLGGAVDAEGRYRVYGVTEFNYAWLSWSLAAYFVGFLLTKIALIDNPTLAARMIESSAPLIEKAPPPSEAGRLIAEILAVCFKALLCAGALMVVDALHHPERGLGRYWPHVSRFLSLAHHYAERRVEAREESVWPSEITVAD